MTPQIILNDAVLAGLAGRPDLVAEFPFLSAASQPAKAKPGGCRCRKAVSPAEAAAADSVRVQIDAMPPDRRARFKELLRTHLVIYWVKTAGGLLRKSF